MENLDQINNWLQTGDRGISSETMFSVLSGIKIAKKYSHPFDVSDLYRCYKLLKTVPAWKYRVMEMSEVSPQWATVALNWPLFEGLSEEYEKTNGGNDEWMAIDSLLFNLGCKNL